MNKTTLAKHIQQLKKAIKIYLPNGLTLEDAAYSVDLTNYELEYILFQDPSLLKMVRAQRSKYKLEKTQIINEENSKTTLTNIIKDYRCKYSQDSIY